MKLGVTRNGMKETFETHKKALGYRRLMMDHRN